MSYYDHAVMITHRLGPWAPAAQPPLDIASKPESQDRTGGFAVLARFLRRMTGRYSAARPCHDPSSAIRP